MHIHVHLRRGNTTTYPLVKFRDVHGDQLGLLMSLQLEEARLFLHDLA